MMFKESTLAVVAPIAQQITDSERRLLIKNDHYPLAVIASMYDVPVQPNQAGYSHALAVATESLIDAANTHMPENATAEFARIGALLGKSLKTITFNTRNHIIPALELLVERYNIEQSTIMAPRLEVKVFDYHSIHDEPRLVNHVQERYTQVQVQPQYRSFLLPEASAEQIIQMLSNHNPHLSTEQVAEWLLHVAPDRLTGVWRTLFGRSRSLDPHTIDFLVVARLPFTVDEIAVAYCLTGHLAENPINVPGESVSLEEWSRTLMDLHHLFGGYLLHAYKRRAMARQEGLLILDSHAKNPVSTRTVSITANGDVYRDWLEAGGQVELLLGAAVYESNLTRAAQLDGREDLIERWHKLYPLIRNACLDHATRQKRQIIETMMCQPAQDVSALLPEISYEELTEHVPVALQQLTEDELENPYLAFAKLVCLVYYPTGSYLSFIKAMCNQSAHHPGSEGRELALHSLVEIAGDWLAEQIKVECFTPLVTPDSTPLPDQPMQEEVSVETEDAPIVVEGLEPQLDPYAIAVQATAETPLDVPASQPTVEDVVQNVEGELGAPEGEWVTEHVPADEHGELPPVAQRRLVPNAEPALNAENPEAVSTESQASDTKTLDTRLADTGCTATRVRVLVAKDPISGAEIVGRYEQAAAKAKEDEVAAEAFDVLCQGWYMEDIKSDAQARAKVMADLDAVLGAQEA